MMIRSALLLLCVTQAFADGIRIDNTAQYVGAGQSRWTVYVAGARADLESIDFVEYTLHPALRQPVRLTRDGQSYFAVSDVSRLAFTVYARVVFKDGREIKKEHILRLGKEAERGQVTLDTRSHYRNDGSWDWFVFLKGGSTQRVACVEYGPSSRVPPEATRVCIPGDDERMPFALQLHGRKPFRVTALVRFYDGFVQKLRRDLVAVRLVRSEFGPCGHLLMENASAGAIFLHGWKVSDGKGFEYRFADRPWFVSGSRLDIEFAEAPECHRAKAIVLGDVIYVAQKLEPPRRVLKLIDHNGDVVQEYHPSGIP